MWSVSHHQKLKKKKKMREMTNKRTALCSRATGWASVQVGVTFLPPRLRNESWHNNELTFRTSAKLCWKGSEQFAFHPFGAFSSLFAAYMTYKKKKEKKITFLNHDWKKKNTDARFSFLFRRIPELPFQYSILIISYVNLVNWSLIDWWRTCFSLLQEGPNLGKKL